MFLRTIFRKIGSPTLGAASQGDATKEIPFRSSWVGWVTGERGVGCAKDARVEKMREGRSAMVKRLGVML